MSDTKKTIVSMQTEERVFAPRKEQSRHAFIGSLDMLIAAHALSLGSTLVTNNTKEFARVPGLHLIAASLGFSSQPRGIMIFGKDTGYACVILSVAKDLFPE